MKDGATRRQFILASTLTGAGITSLTAATGADQKFPSTNEAQAARLAMRHGQWKGTTVYLVK